MSAPGKPPPTPNPARTPAGIVPAPPPDPATRAIRLAAALATLGLLTLAGWQAQALWQRLQAPPPDPAPLAARLPAGADPDQSDPAPTRHWPALFGQFQRPEPQPPAPPKPPAPPMPPVESLGYRLQGTVRSGDTLWAIVAHPTGQRILRPGDSLAEGLVVDAITEEGLWLQSGESRALLKFPAPGSP